MTIIKVTPEEIQDALSRVEAGMHTVEDVNLLRAVLCSISVEDVYDFSSSLSSLATDMEKVKHATHELAMEAERLAQKYD